MYFIIFVNKSVATAKPVNITIRQKRVTLASSKKDAVQSLWTADRSEN